MKNISFSVLLFALCSFFTTALSAQTYVSSSEAITLLNTEINSIQDGFSTQTDKEAYKTSLMEIRFYRGILKSLNGGETTENAIEETTTAWTSVMNTKNNTKKIASYSRDASGEVTYSREKKSFCYAIGYQHNRW